MQNGNKRFVYILQSLSTPDRQYIGRTEDLSSRLASHNNGESPQTAKHRPWRLHVAFWFVSEELAARFEKFLKSASGRSFARQHFEQSSGP